jgi:predicted O-methyltransferase YrrM
MRRCTRVEQASGESRVAQVGRGASSDPGRPPGADSDWRSRRPSGPSGHAQASPATVTRTAQRATSSDTKGGHLCPDGERATPVTTPEDARAVVGDAGGGTTPSRGETLHRFVRTQGFTACLELGFAHGVGSVYIASALEAAGAGALTSVDIPSALNRTPSATSLLARAGLSHRVQLVIDPDSYIWWLRRRLREQLRDGRVEPAYDFVFIDGAHTWDTDALAFALVDRLIKPGGWILFDDLAWLPGDPNVSDVPDDTRSFPHVAEVWELLVLTDPSYDEVRTNGSWGYARKSLSTSPQVRTVVKTDLLIQLRQLARMARHRVREARGG